MDIDAFVSSHEASWRRLAELAGQRRHSGEEADELARLYQQAAGHLSQVRTHAPDPWLVSQLSMSLVQARGRLLGSRVSTWASVKRFVTVVMPLSLYRVRWWIVAVTVAFVGLALVVGARMALDAGALESFGSAEFRQDIVDKQFAAYYSEFPHPSFAAAVWTNNALVALTCLATGITGVFPAVILAINAANVGALGGLMVSYGAGNVFFSLILPHGMLELTCVFVATAAGARLLWALLVPGARPRARALGEEGRAIAGVAAACVVGLAVSGILEGFVTPSSMAWWVKILVGGVCCAAFWLWMWVVGGRAFRAGQSTEGEVAQAVLPVAG